MKPTHLFLLAVFALGGCAAMPGQEPVTAYGYLHPTGQDGRLLAVVSPWTPQDIDHAVLTLSSGDTLVSTLTIAKADLARRVAFSNLKQATTYTVQAKAYHDASGTAEIDDASLLPSSCTTTFTTALDPSVTFGTIALRLVDRTFSGTATGGLSVQPGQVLDPTEDEAIAFPARALTVFAGSASAGALDGTGTLAGFEAPKGLALDASGTVYVADARNNEIRKISPAGVVTTLAGSTSPGNLDGTGAAATFNFPTDVAVDAGGNVYVADAGNDEIRKISPAGVVTTLAGSTSPGNLDGAGTAARFAVPYGVAVDARGTVYVADEANNEIRKISPAGVVTTLAGSGAIGFASGSGAGARFYFPRALAVDPNDNVYVADALNRAIRKVTPAGVVSTLCTLPGSPDGVALDGNGDLFVTVAGTNALYFVTPAGEVTTPFSSLSASWGVAADAGGSVYTTSGNQIMTLH